MLQALDEIGTDKIKELCNKIYDSGYIPETMKNSTFILLTKKPKAENCTDFRTISLMGHVTKILQKSILYRNSAAIDREIGENQSGFRKRKGYTRRNIQSENDKRDISREAEIFIYMLYRLRKGV